MRIHRPKLRLSVTLIIILVLAAAILNIVILYRSANYLSQQRLELKQQSALYDKQIEALKARKLAEQKAAEAKKAADDAAKQAAIAASGAQSKSPTTSCPTSGTHSDPSAIDFVVNKKRCINPLNYTPSDLVNVNGAIVSAKVQPDLSAMFTAATAAGVPLNVTSSFRSYDNQVATYNYWVAQNGSTKGADTVSARPGFSEHQTGFAMDLSAGSCSLECFRTTAQYTWLHDHAAEYGFIERYQSGYESITGYSPEAWHYRYVGTTVASDMKVKAIHSLEQYWNIPGGDYPN